MFGRHPSMGELTSFGHGEDDLSSVGGKTTHKCTIQDCPKVSVAGFVAPLYLSALHPVRLIHVDPPYGSLSLQKE